MSGYYQPVDMNGVWNTVKGGSTVPLKFELFAGTTELTRHQRREVVHASRASRAPVRRPWPTTSS